MDYFAGSDSNIKEVQAATGLDSDDKVISACASGSSKQLGAIWLAGVLKIDAAVPVLLRLVNDHDRSIACRAVQSIGLIRSQSAVIALAETLRTVIDIDVRKRILYALGQIGGQKAAETLIDVVLNDLEDNGVRAEAAEALSSCSGECRDQACSALVRVLSDDDPHIRFFSLYSLGSLKCRGAEQVIAKCLSDHATAAPYGTISEEAAWALEEIGKDRRATECR